MRPLNKVQQKSIFRTIMAEEFVLIRGMPGSGKSTCIVALIRLLVVLGKSVLLTSYTHAAVDNVLVKLLHEDKEGAAPFLRVGQTSRLVTFEGGSVHSVDKLYLCLSLFNKGHLLLFIFVLPFNCFLSLPHN